MSQMEAHKMNTSDYIEPQWIPGHVYKGIVVGLQDIKLCICTQEMHASYSAKVPKKSMCLIDLDDGGLWSHLHDGVQSVTDSHIWEDITNV